MKRKNIIIFFFSLRCASSPAFRAPGRFYVFERYDRALLLELNTFRRRRNLQRATPLRYEFVESRRSAMEHKGCRSNEVLELAREDVRRCHVSRKTHYVVSPRERRLQRQNPVRYFCESRKPRSGTV